MIMVVEPSEAHVHVFRRLFVYQVQESADFLVKAGQLYYNKQRNYGILAM
ncbi:hypothetical protein QF041_000187 [Paenibacillus sp. W2I17]|nr:hypothetical protein [Paenibacillus sp. W2I17]